MQKIALLIAVLSLGAGCASQGTGMASSSGSSSSRADRYPWMNSQSDLSSDALQRGASGSVIVQTPSTSAQFDPAMASTGSLSADADMDMDMDKDLDLSLDADRSIDSNLDVSAAGGPAGLESGSSLSADVDMDTDIDIQNDSTSETAIVDRQPSDDLHSGSSTWSSKADDQRRADFEGAVATDSITEVSGGPAGSESSSSASSSLQVGDSSIQTDASVGRAADVDVQTSTFTSADVDVDVDTTRPDVDVDTHISEPGVNTRREHDIKADSSIRGGSDRAREIDLRHMDSENPRNYTEEKEIKADSSIRGASDRVRGVQLREMDTETQRSWNDRNRIKADSSVRGASAQARGTDRLWMSGNRPADVPTGRVTKNEPDFLHKMNPASGSPAPTHSGRAEAFSPGIHASGTVGSTAGLADRVKKSLVRENSGTGGMLSKDIARNIKVQENDGTVILTGSVPSERTSRLIEIRAAEVRGVKKVENRLTVNRDSLPAERNVDADSGVDIDIQRR